MSQRIVIVGAVAAGASAAAKARRTDEEAEIVLLDSGPYMSFANCGLPYFIGGEIAARQSLFVANAEQFRNRFNVALRLDSEVLDILPAERRIVHASPNGARVSLDYERLILATGTVPLRPPVPGLDGADAFFCRTVPDVDAIVARLALLPAAEARALVIGGGYIGLECAEQLQRRGLTVTLVEAMDQLMGPLDPEMTAPVQAALESLGVEVILGDALVRIDPAGPRHQAVLKSGATRVFDLAIVATGVRPNVALAKAAGLTMGKTGAIAVDAHQRTSDPAIFAAGDNSEAVFLPTGQKVNIPLASPANKQGRIAGQNAALDLAGVTPGEGSRLAMKGVLGTSIVRAGTVTAGGTGLTEKLAARLGIPTEIAYIHGASHAGYYPGAQPMLLKLLYAPQDGRLLGAQVVGQEGVDKRIDILATAISGGMGVADLEDLDLSYAPPFASARDGVIMAGFAASNALRGVSPGCTPQELARELAGENPPFLLDVRTRQEYQEGRLRQAVNVPLDELRKHLSAIPRDRDIVVQCRSGYRSYVAQRILLNNGWNRVRNLWGGYLLAQRIAGLADGR